MLYNTIAEDVLFALDKIMLYINSSQFNNLRERATLRRHWTTDPHALKLIQQGQNIKRITK
jgi:hypothetical protein